MARFTDNNKWKDKWFRELEPAQKLLWLFILDDCDNAGFFEYDEALFSFFTGMDESRVKGAFEGLKRGLLGAKSGDLYHINGFLEAQKNLPLNESNNAHKQIIRLLKDRREAFDCGFEEYLGAKEGLISPTGKGKGKGSSKGKSKKPYSEEFESFWKEYGVGVKRNAFDAWLKQNPSPEEIKEIMRCVPVYKAYCSEVERSFKDGQGWINGRFWESEWTHQAQGTTGKATPKKTVDLGDIIRKG